MAETEAVLKIASELENIRVLLLFINMALWFILFFKRGYSNTIAIKDAIQELTRYIKQRR